MSYSSKIIPRYSYLSNFFIISLLFLSASFNTCGDHSKPSDAKAFSDTITVMSYNIENLFDLVDNGTEYPDYKPYKSGSDG